MSRVSADRSSAPPSFIGVTIATRLPFSIKHHLKKPAFYPDTPFVLLEIGEPDFDPRRARERRKRGSVAIDGKDLRAACREKQRVTAVTGGEIEHAPPGGDERREAYDPGRRCQPEMTAQGGSHRRPWARSRPGSLGALFVPRRRGTPRRGPPAGRSPSAASARTSSCSQSLNACPSGRSA